MAILLAWRFWPRCATELDRAQAPTRVECSTTYGDAPDASATLNLFWTARIVAGEPVAADDVAELRWFAANELPADDELAFTLLPSVFEAWREAVDPG
jgi:hypothetical protein